MKITNFKGFLLIIYLLIFVVEIKAKTFIEIHIPDVLNPIKIVSKKPEISLYIKKYHHRVIHTLYQTVK